MSQPEKTKNKTLSEVVVARAAQLHDAAFADDDRKKKPSWEESIRQAQEEIPGEKPEPEPA